MHYRVKKFVTIARNYAGNFENSGMSRWSKNHMPPSEIMRYLTNAVERINNLVDATDAEKKEGTDIIWNLYKLVQDYAAKYTSDDTWNNSVKKDGNWSPNNNKEVSFTTYGDSFDAVIDNAVMPNPTTKVRRYDDD